MPTWIYPSTYPDGSEGNPVILAFHGTEVTIKATGEKVWIRANVAEWLRAETWPSQRVPVAHGTHKPQFVINSDELDL